MISLKDLNSWVAMGTSISKSWVVCRLSSTRISSMYGSSTFTSSYETGAVSARVSLCDLFSSRVLQSLSACLISSRPPCCWLFMRYYPNNKRKVGRIRLRKNR